MPTDENNRDPKIEAAVICALLSASRDRMLEELALSLRLSRRIAELLAESTEVPDAE